MRHRYLNFNSDFTADNQPTYFWSGLNLLHYLKLFLSKFRLPIRAFLVRTFRHRAVGRDLESILEHFGVGPVQATAGLRRAPLAARLHHSADEESHHDQFHKTAQVHDLKNVLHINFQ